MRLIWWCMLPLVSAAQCILDTTGPSYDQDPILEQQPNFARSLPVQILMTGIIFALVSVLLIHLIFTAQYHWPLAPMNYVLQVSSVLIMLISLIATILVVLAASRSDSQEWPYMLTYIAVAIPPVAGTSGLSAWGTAEQAAWSLMSASTSLLIQITHIQFLTLLYPSHLEARLIFILLGPLAFLSAAMQLAPIHQQQRIVDVADIIQNICNATLSLLFTVALFMWGLLVNRKQAWRTDGGTAAFGAGALFFAVISTTLNFLIIPTDNKYVWLPGLMLAVVLWQSFLGWWWWVGGGMGVGEVEELIRREGKRERKRTIRCARRSERKQRTETLWESASQSFGFASVSTEGLHPLWSVNAGHDLTQIASLSPPTECAPVLHTNANDPSSEGEVRSFLSITLPSQAWCWNSWPRRFFRQWYCTLRQAHLSAAHIQALERVERRQQIYGADMSPRGTVKAEIMGWGLGSFGVREREKRVSSRHDNQEESQFDVMSAEQFELGRASELRDGGWTMSWWGPLQRCRLRDSTMYAV